MQKKIYEISKHKLHGSQMRCTKCKENIKKDQQGIKESQKVVSMFLNTRWQGCLEPLSKNYLNFTFKEILPNRIFMRLLQVLLHQLGESATTTIVVSMVKFLSYVIELCC